MWLLHGFVDRGQAAGAGLPRRLPRLAPNAPISLLDAGPLAFLASDLRGLAAIGRSLQSVLDSPEQASALAVAHNRLLCVAVEKVDVLPVRFGSMLPAECDVAARLAERAKAANAQFDAVRGAAEYAIRLVAAPSSGQSEMTPAPRTGRNYLAAKLKRRQVREDRRAAVSAVSKEIELVSQDISRDVVKRPVARHAAGANAVDDRPQRILDLALLVDRGRVAHFSEIVEQHSTLARGVGLVLEAVGPWPPFHFIAASDAGRSGNGGGAVW